MTCAVVSGGFDPLHEGHVAYIQAAAAIGNVVVILNSDAWLTRKKGKPVLPFATRRAVVMALKGVTRVYEADDADGTVCQTLEDVYYTGKPEELLVFCKGGDRSETTVVPEMETCRRFNIPVVLGCGGYNKANSSSELIKRAQG